MKSQDFLLMYKLVSLYAQEERLVKELSLSDSGPSAGAAATGPALGWGSFASVTDDSPFADLDWYGWAEPTAVQSSTKSWSEHYSLRNLSASLGLSKSEISNSLRRCEYAGLVYSDHDTNILKVNRRELLQITEFALKYFYPVRPGAIVRGIPTGFAAPALNRHLKSAGTLLHVWPDPSGSERGQLIEPLYKTVPQAAKQDRYLYHYLALVDAIRVGGPRETGVAVNILREGMGLK
ncbi:MarR family transcriptional regulator [Pseudomonas sp. NPDC089408]|uniref:MarR family transcriptional regulator n=1 Tax=Pseudomonas sp. NPDC089408 TaxID=3364465 RepID=UPI0038010F85